MVSSTQLLNDPDEKERDLSVYYINMRAMICNICINKAWSLKHVEIIENKFIAKNSTVTRIVRGIDLKWGETPQALRVKVR